MASIFQRCAQRTLHALTLWLLHVLSEVEDSPLVWAPLLRNGITLSAGFEATTNLFRTKILLYKHIVENKQIKADFTAGCRNRRGTKFI